MAEKHRSASKKIMQVFGKYNPKTKDFSLSNQDALLDRIKQNIEVSPTVKNLLIQKKLIEGKKVKAWRPKIKEKTEEATKPEKVADKKVEEKSETVTPEEPKKEAVTQETKG